MSKTVITSANASVKLGNVDFFSAKRELGTRVTEFMYCVVRKKEVNETYNGKIESLKASIDNLEKLAGSIMADQIPLLKASAFDQITKFESERNDLIKKQATFEYTEFEKELKKKMNKGIAEDELAEEVAKWFDAYGLNVRNTYFLEEVLGTFGSKVDVKVVIRSDGKKCMRVDAANAIKNIYGVTYEHMVQVGCIKSTAIPELLREKYGKKSNSGKRVKKNKK